MFINFYLRKLVRDKTAQLQANERHLKLTLNSIGDAVIATDTSGRITRMNPVAESLTAWPLAEAQGKHLIEVFKIINAHTGKPCENPVQKVLNSGTIQDLANHTALLAKDGQKYQIADSASPIEDENNNIIGVL